MLATALLGVSSILDVEKCTIWPDTCSPGVEDAMQFWSGSESPSPPQFPTIDTGSTDGGPRSVRVELDGVSAQASLGGVNVRSVG